MSFSLASRNTFNLTVVGRLLAYLSGDRIATQFAKVAHRFVVPLLAIGVFLMLWSVGARNVETSLGQLPGPAKVWEQTVALFDEHQAERAKQDAFDARMEQRVQAAITADKTPERIEKLRSRRYTGAPTFFDQIITSLVTVATGFLIGSLVAIPIGVVCGMSQTLYQALNPIIQIFKPVSPLAWLPLVTMVVSAVYVSADPLFDKSFLTSAITVTLCCLWPTLINTTVGIFGVFDIASEMGIEKHDEDLGQTFAVWGASSGPYFVVPFFGPNTIRSTVALPFDLRGTSLVRPEDIAVRNSLTGLRLVHKRWTLLGADRAVEEGSLDRYGYIRDFYLQQRRYEIFDGNPPRERFDDARTEPLNPRVLAHVEADDVAVGSMSLALVAQAHGGTPARQ